MSDGANSTLGRRRLILPEMEGFFARWYARQRGTRSQLALYRQQAAQLTAAVPDGAAVLEVAPGPGYLAIEMSRLGRLRVTGLDISKTMIEIAREHAHAARVPVDFRHGDAAAMPFADDSFELIVCQAAFKNFRQPVTVLNEMHRVLRPKGVAVIQDLRKEATTSDIDREVESQNLSAVNGFVTRRILARLRSRAYSVDHFEKIVAESTFQAGEIRVEGIGLEVRLRRQAGAAP